MNGIRFALFFAVFLAVYGGMHWYVYSRVAGGLGMTGGAVTALRVFFLLAALSFLAAEFAVRRSTGLWVRPVAFLGTTWLGVLSIALAGFVLRDIAGLFVRTPGFRYWSTVTALVLIGVAAGYSLYNVAAVRTLRDLRLSSPDLPPELDGFTIVQISDIHLNLASSAEWIDGVVRNANALSPDLIVLTGDLIDADICSREDLCRALASLRAGHGVYAVTGNHEAYTGIDVFLRTMHRAGIAVLRNETVPVADGRIALTGIDDGVSQLAGKAYGPIRDALSRPGPRGPDRFSILLSHRPDAFIAASRLGVDLQLSGHTHIGQIPPLDLIVLAVFRYPFGFHQSGGSALYTTSGTGWWGPPMRLFSRCELVRVVLDRKERPDAL